MPHNDRTFSTGQLSRRTFLSFGITGLTISALTSCERPSPSDRPEITTPPSSHDDDWSAIRAHFITKPGVTFMNNASIGMPPGVVAEAVARGYESVSRDPIHAKHELNDLVQNRVRPHLAQFIGAKPSEIVLTRNASEALHLAAVGLVLEPGDEVLMTSQEHPAGRQPWRYRVSRHGITATEVFIPSPFSDEEDVVERMAAQISRRTRAIAFCHVTRGGHLYPVRKLAALAKERGIATIVDGAQAIGMLPVDVHDLGCDAYAASLHKWLLGPMGTGVLYIGEESRHRFQSVYNEESTSERPNYEPIGTVGLPVKAGLEVALSFLDAIGIAAIERRNRYLSNYLKAQLGEMPGVRVFSGPTERTSAPGSTIFEMDDVDADNAVNVLAQRRSIHIDEHKRDGHNAIRVSTHFYNTTKEIDHLINAMKTSLRPG